MTTQRFALARALAGDPDHARSDDETIWVVENTVHELLDHARRESTRLLWSTFTVGTGELTPGIGLVRVAIVGVVEDVEGD